MLDKEYQVTFLSAVSFYTLESHSIKMLTIIKHHFLFSKSEVLCFWKITEFVVFNAYSFLFGNFKWVEFTDINLVTFHTVFSVWYFSVS